MLGCYHKDEAAWLARDGSASATRRRHTEPTASRVRLTLLLTQQCENFHKVEKDCIVGIWGIADFAIASSHCDAKEEQGLGTGKLRWVLFFTGCLENNTYKYSSIVKNDNSRYVMKLSDVKITLQERSNPYGRVPSGHITLRGLQAKTVGIECILVTVWVFGYPGS